MVVPEESSRIDLVCQVHLVRQHVETDADRWRALKTLESTRFARQRVRDCLACSRVCWLANHPGEKSTTTDAVEGRNTSKGGGIVSRDGKDSHHIAQTRKCHKY